MIDQISNNLQKGIYLLNALNVQQYCDTTVAPYYSSIGSHMRHILDFYDCILDGLENNRIDLTHRRRDLETEQVCEKATKRIVEIDRRLKNLHTATSLEQPVAVVDDLGGGSVTFSSTLGALLAQANSHTIHHYAIINYILASLDISVNDGDFGYNPTTPKTSA